MTKDKEREVFEMSTEEKRLSTFKKWPYGSDTSINKEKMAAAGFYYIGNKKEPDLVRCFVCLKELDGWEVEDDPWEEHKNHASYCQFIHLNKAECEITFEEMHDLEMYRQINMATKVLTKKIKEFEKQAANTREVLQTLA
ncbi:baculoviral IAP repeat-containing protein 5 [Penaeus vannamei]|uniref:Inhibition of apoptosis protein n=1 Tax=Penaeus vannamei TaxID=6689 RepID=L7SU02_PENVA|nr:baculoviral IAP repeat-containing protein 5-like [Penaeus vannamei]ADY38395.1 survivin [Penaeus vannamei]AGC24178.1 inhibition of apoptosis protein [Penaeus vannamei]